MVKTMPELLQQRNTDGCYHANSKVVSTKLVFSIWVGMLRSLLYSNIIVETKMVIQPWLCWTIACSYYLLIILHSTHKLSYKHPLENA